MNFVIIIFGFLVFHPVTPFLLLRDEIRVMNEGTSCILWRFDDDV